MFSNCQQSNPSPSGGGGGGSSTPCGFLTGTGLTWNPTVTMGGISVDFCSGSQIVTQNNVHTSASISFNSYCSGSQYLDWMLQLVVMDINGVTVGTLYPATVTPLGVINAVCSYTDYSCNPTPMHTYQNLDYTNPAATINGAVKITNINWNNYTIDGEFYFEVTDYVTGSSMTFGNSSNYCTFSGLEFMHINM